MCGHRFLTSIHIVYREKFKLGVHPRDEYCRLFLSEISSIQEGLPSKYSLLIILAKTLSATLLAPLCLLGAVSLISTTLLLVSCQWEVW